MNIAMPPIKPLGSYNLANLLNLLGQRRREGDKDIIALELK